jgi:hypothetical protein
MKLAFGLPFGLRMLRRIMNEMKETMESMFVLVLADSVFENMITFELRVVQSC